MFYYRGAGYSSKCPLIECELYGAGCSAAAPAIGTSIDTLTGAVTTDTTNYLGLGL